MKKVEQEVNILKIQKKMKMIYNNSNKQQEMGLRYGELVGIKKIDIMIGVMNYDKMFQLR